MSAAAPAPDEPAMPKLITSFGLEVRKGQIVITAALARAMNFHSVQLRREPPPLETTLEKIMAAFDRFNEQPHRSRLLYDEPAKPYAPSWAHYHPRKED